jgi:hypothetical protein
MVETIQQMRVRMSTVHVAAATGSRQKPKGPKSKCIAMTYMRCIQVSFLKVRSDLCAVDPIQRSLH